MRRLGIGGAAVASAVLGIGVWTMPAAAGAADAVPLAPLAYTYGEQETARSLAMGGALRAVGNGTSAVYLNPANMALSRLYHIEGFAQFTPEATRVLGGATVVDSLTSSTRLAGGLALVAGIIDQQTEQKDAAGNVVKDAEGDSIKTGLNRTVVDVRAAVAYPIGDRVFLGLGGRYLRVDQEGNGQLGVSQVSGGLAADKGRVTTVNTATFDAGVTVRFTKGVYLGVSGQNLSRPGNSLLPMMIGGGLGYTGERFTLEADGLADLDTWGRATLRAMVGGEYIAADHFPLRLGYRFDQGLGVHLASAGLGYTSKEFAIELAARRTLSGTVNATMLGISATYHLESSKIVQPQAVERDE
jgi:hypothetical protein